MNKDLLFLPEHIEFEPDSIVECKTSDESLDELQALNTALCFLCSINADAKEVETFLTEHPDALLLEGVGNLPDESAHFIVSEQMNRCECFNVSCNQNRMQVLTILGRGFEYYQSKSFRLRRPARLSWAFQAAKLMKVERDIRQLRVEEMATRHRLLESAVEVRSFQDELEQVHKFDSKSSALQMFACTRKNDLFERKSVLEYRIGVASLSLSSVEREHKVLLSEIRHGRRMQFATLKKAFDGCKRHVCVVSKPTLHNNLSVSKRA
jgi:hypothetical protein